MNSPCWDITGICMIRHKSLRHIWSYGATTRHGVYLAGEPHPTGGLGSSVQPVSASSPTTKPDLGEPVYNSFIAFLNSKLMNFQKVTLSRGSPLLLPGNEIILIESSNKTNQRVQLHFWWNCVNIGLGTLANQGIQVHLKFWYLVGMDGGMNIAVTDVSTNKKFIVPSHPHCWSRQPSQTSRFV